MAGKGTGQPVANIAGVGLREGRNGGTLVVVPKGGPSPNPSGRSDAWYMLLKRAKEAAPDALEGMILAMQSEDERLAYMARDWVFTRAYGKPKEAEQEQAPKAAIDVGKLSDAELHAFQKLLRKMSGDANQEMTHGNGGPILEAEVEEVENDDD